MFIARSRTRLAMKILMVLGALAAGRGAIAAEPSRGTDPQEPPRVVHVAPVAPDILGIEIQDGRILPMRHIPYQKEPGDRIETRTNPKTGETREARLIRNGRAVGFLIGSERKVLNVFEKLLGEPLDVALADQAQTYRVSSPDDPAYRQGAAPAGVSRKTKSNNVCDQDLAPTKRHWIYFKLPKGLSLGKRYFVRFPGLRLNVPAVDFVYDPETLRSEAVHVSQIGFRPDDPGKCAFLSVWLGTGGGHSYPPGLRFALIDHRTGEHVYSGNVTLAWKASEPEQIGRKVNYNRTDVYRMDFGDFQRPGQYRVSVEGVGCSYPFEIGAEVWVRALRIAMKGMYHQRSGVTLQPPYTDFLRPRGFHPDDGVKVFQSTCPLMYSGNGLNALGQDRNNFDNLVAGKTEQVVPGLWGGYMDAGDWDRRVQHLRVSRLQLELFELFPQFFRAISWNIPESGKGLPDLIAEVLFQVDFYHRLQTPEGGVRGGIESSEHPVPGETSWLESQMVLTYAPDPWCSFMYAGVAARTAYVLRQLDAARAPQYEQSALKAMSWGETEYAKWLKGPDYAKVRGGAKSEVARERNLAAVELYRLTRDRKWHDLLVAALGPEPLQKAPFAGQFDAAFVYARLDESLADPALKRQAIEAILGEAEQVMRISKGNAFGITARYLGPYSSAFSNPARTELIRAHALTGKPEYLAAILRAAQFSSGANPMNVTMTTGVGHDWPRNILHEDMKHTGQEAPIGITVFGPADHPRPDWFLTRLQKECTPPAMEWPLVEGYFDVYLWAPVCEYTVDSSMIATEYAWGYLAARQ